MNDESACPSLIANGSLRVRSIPFSRIPGQSELFLRYQKDPGSLREFYPNAPSSLDDIRSYARTAADAYTLDRKEVADALQSLNEAIGTGEKTAASIASFRKSGTVAVFTGQQTGLLGGPLYTIYKALTAIKLAADLTEAGTPAVPMFWAATEDHDFEEVATVTMAGMDALVEAVYSETDRGGIPVGDRVLTADIDRLIRELASALPQTEHTEIVFDDLRRSWTEGTRFGLAFLRQMAGYFKNFGLIFVDPQHEELKRLSAPLMALAAERSEKIVEGIKDKNARLISLGFHQQVFVEDGYFPLFWLSDEGVRTPLRSDGDTIRNADGNTEFSRADLVDTIEREPERFSAGVMLRPAVQDYLFPTAAYVGGAAEIAYFAQGSAVYETLDRPVTPIIHRQSFSIVEPKHQRTLSKYGLDLERVFESKEDVMARVAETVVGTDAARLFADVEEKVNAELRRLDEYFTGVDPTLAANLATRRRKIIYHLSALRKKAYNAEIRRDRDAERRLNRLFRELYPHGALQERTLNVASFLDRYGPDLIDWLYTSIDLEDKGHRVIYL